MGDPLQRKEEGSIRQYYVRVNRFEKENVQWESSGGGLVLCPNILHHSVHHLGQAGQRHI